MTRYTEAQLEEFGRLYFGCSSGQARCRTIDVDDYALRYRNDPTFHNEEPVSIPTGLQTPVGSDFGDDWNYQGAAVPGEMTSMPSPVLRQGQATTRSGSNGSRTTANTIFPQTAPLFKYKESPSLYSADLEVRSLRSYTGSHTSFFELDRKGQFTVAERGVYTGNPIKQQYYYDGRGDIQPLYPHDTEGQRQPEPEEEQRPPPYQFEPELGSYLNERYPGARCPRRVISSQSLKHKEEISGMIDGAWAHQCKSRAGFLSCKQPERAQDRKLHRTKNFSGITKVQVATKKKGRSKSDKK